MLIYNYDEFTKEYTGYCEADLDPAESKAQGKEVYLIPAYATDKKPPKPKTNETVLFNEGSWQIVADYRGKYIVNNDMDPIIYDKLGNLPDGYIVITEAQAKKIQEDSLYYIISDGKLIKNPDYDEQKAQEREKEFYSKFLATSKGNYRLQPRGYSNAQQSIDTINGNVRALGSLSEEIAQMVIFYPTPNFAKEEQCTEEWLISHQYNITPMTLQEWSIYYLEFSKLYALDQYKKSNEGG